MKEYVLKQKGLLAAAILFGTIFSVGSTLIALILKEVIDVAISGDRNRFTNIVIQTIIYLAALGLCYWGYSVFSKKFIAK